MAAVTLTTLRARTRERADMVNSTFVTDTADSLDAFINSSAQELHDLLIEKYGSDYKVSSAAFVTVSGVSAVALPADFYKLLGVDLQVGSIPQDLQPFTFKERNSFKAGGMVHGAEIPRYRLEGSNLRLYPIPGGPYNGTIWYVPTLALMVAGGNTIDFPNGYEEYVVIDAAIKCLAKEESDTSVLQLAKQEQVARIERAAENRDAGAPQSAVDVEMRNLDPWWGF